MAEETNYAGIAKTNLRPFRLPEKSQGGKDHPKSPKVLMTPTIAVREAVRRGRQAP